MGNRAIFVIGYFIEAGDVHARNARQSFQQFFARTTAALPILLRARDIQDQLFAFAYSERVNEIRHRFWVVTGLPASNY
jgi:hypothetical protein